MPKKQTVLLDRIATALLFLPSRMRPVPYCKYRLEELSKRPDITLVLSPLILEMVRRELQFVCESSPEATTLSIPFISRFLNALGNPSLLANEIVACLFPARHDFYRLTISITPRAY